jgi:hypothetical protein
MPSETAIFYNIYTAPGNSKHTLGIVEEQLTAWRASKVANSPLYYMLLGEKIKMPCKRNEKCSLLEHKEVGDEVDTLQELHAYCTKNPQDSVIYIHSKGSFHDNEENTVLRRLLMNAVFSDACTSIKTDDSCNICSARFSPIPHWHSSGNMWMAQCDYIRNLIPPKSFRTYVDKAVAGACRRWHWEMPPHPSLVGQERFANEHWVHTHPNVNPCDVYTTGDFSWGYVSVELDTNPKFVRARAPRFPRQNFGEIQRPTWINLEYRLFELRTMYNETPPADSWVWDFYLAWGKIKIKATPHPKKKKPKRKHHHRVH